jgi:hypothetical protein
MGEKYKSTLTNSRLKSVILFAGLLATVSTHRKVLSAAISGFLGFPLSSSKC